MIRSLPFIVVLTTAISFCRVCFGQEQAFYPFRKYSQADGLSSYNITKIIQDTNGFVWIGTQDGLNCFDGKTFLTFNKQKDARHLLNGNNVTDMIVDPKRHLIWIATSYGGIGCVNTDSRTMQPLILQDQTALAFKDIWVHSLAIVGDILWIGTYAGVHAYDLQQHVFLHLDNHFTATNFQALKIGRLLADPKGRIWAFCDGDGILVFDGKSGKLLNQIGAEKLNFYGSKKTLLFWNVSLSEQNGILAATNWGIRVIDPNADVVREEGFPSASKAADKRAFFTESEIFNCIDGRDGNIWFSNAHGLFRLHSNTQKVHKIQENNDHDDSWQSAVYSLYADNSGRIWLGSEEGLSYFIPRPPGFEKYYTSYNSNVKIQHAFSIYPANDSIIYCGAANGLYEVHTRQHSIRKLSEASSCYLVSPVTDKQILVSNSQGIFVISREGLFPIRQLYPEFKVVENDLLASMIRYNDSMIIMGSELHKGLYVWNTKRGTIRLFASGTNGLMLDDGTINSIYKDRAGQVWVLSEHSMVRFDPFNGIGVCIHLRDPVSRQNCSILFDICETADSYWIAAYGMGLIEADKQMQVKRILSERDGLCNNGVYKVFSHHDSLVIITSNSGISVVNVKNRGIRNFFESDGLQSNSFEQFCGVSKNETIYTGGVNGFTRIFPDNLTVNQNPPELYITNIRMDHPSGSVDTSGLNVSYLEVPANVYQTTIYFSGLNFSNPERIRYAYHIKELNNEWNNLESQNFINLIGLNPGEYTLEIKAANEDGFWNERPAKLSLVYLPKWYQTIWFKLLVVAGITGLLFAFYRYRISQYKKQQQIRRDIAGDLHDDLGSTLNTVKVLTHLAKREPLQEQHLDRIEESLATATTGLRDMIWVLDDVGDTVQGLMDRIRKSVLPAITAGGIKLDCMIEPGLNDHTISKSEKRNLLLVAREAVTNSIKYAQCRHIHIKIRLINNKTSLRIQDDGKGFDMHTSMGPDCNGLKNMRYRAQQIHYAFHIESGKDSGTVLEFTRS